MMIKPQKKQKQEKAEMLNRLKAGDDVYTVGGVFGTVHAVKKDSVVLKVDDKVKIEFSMNAVGGIRKTDDGDDDSDNSKK